MSTAIEEKVIPFDSDEAASVQTLTGWVSRRGFFYGDDERLARYDGCTHKPCERCGELTEKGYTICPGCRDLRAEERFAQMPRKEWDGVTPLVIYRTDRYFFDEDDLDDYCADNEVARDDLPLVICEPCKPRLVSALDLYDDALTDDADGNDIPTAVREAVDVLNKALRAAAPLAWTEGKYVAVLHPSETD